MELKRILARDSRAANEKAIQLYGPNVLIISSQRLDNQIELIVAVDLDAAPEAQPAAAPAQAAASSSTASEAFVPFSKLFQSASSFAPLPETEPERAPVVAQPAQTLGAPELAVAPAVAAASAPVAALTQAPPVAAALATSPAAAAQQMQHESQRSQEIVDLLRLEMAALRKEFSLSRQMMPWQNGLRLSPAVEQLSMAMSEVGVPAGLRALLTDSIQALDSVEEAWPVMRSLLSDALSRPAMSAPESGVHALCGPSGAGKTSMVARLACAAALVHGAEQQVMVSFADQRPGAWSQMQLLAAQSGVACYRASDSDMLKTLLDELDGKTVWIDTCGTDFAAQAQLLMTQHPKVSRHAVLPVDATVTSVQKILQNSQLQWSSLMLSKVDEAAYPWALVKGLSEQPLAVSCVAGDSRVAQAPIAFDAAHLVDLALAPLRAHMASAVPSVDVSQLVPSAPVEVQPARAARAIKLESPRTPAAAPMGETTRMRSFNPVPMNDDILIPTLAGAVSLPSVRSKTARAGSVQKAVHG